MAPRVAPRQPLVESTISRILTRLHIRYPFCFDHDAVRWLASAREAEASHLRATFSEQHGYLMYFHGLPKGPQATTLSMHRHHHHHHRHHHRHHRRHHHPHPLVLLHLLILLILFLILLIITILIITNTRTTPDPMKERRLQGRTSNCFNK